MHRHGYILLIESDYPLRALLEGWLRDAGYRVIIGDCDIQAREEVLSLVIADIASPRGGEALIRSLHSAYPAPVLAISARFRQGLGSSPDVAHRLGVTQVLPKPFSRAELLSAVREAIKSSP